MKQTETQQNWNTYFDNPKKSNTNIRWGFIIFILLCIGCAALYVYNNPNEPNIDSSTSNNFNIADKIESAKNGQTMYESINTIENIFDTIENKSISELNDCIATVQNLTLSIEYKEFRQLVIDKLSYFIMYKENNNIEYLNKYNNIQWIDELASVFDEIGIDYEITHDENKTQIHFQYKDY